MGWLVDACNTKLKNFASRKLSWECFAWKLNIHLSTTIIPSTEPGRAAVTLKRCLFYPIYILCPARFDHCPCPSRSLNILLFNQHPPHRPPPQSLSLPASAPPSTSPTPIPSTIPSASVTITSALLKTPLSASFLGSTQSTGFLRALSLMRGSQPASSRISIIGNVVVVVVVG